MPSQTSQTAFQPSTFQNDAFQIGRTILVPTPLGPQHLLPPYSRFPHGVPISAATFGRETSAGVARFSRGHAGSVGKTRKVSAPVARFSKRRGPGEDQDGSTPTRD